MERSKSWMERNLNLHITLCFVLFIFFSSISVHSAALPDETNPSHIDFSNIISSNASSGVSSSLAVDHLVDDLKDRIELLFEKTTSPECQAKIATHFSYYINAIGLENELPFTNAKFNNSCPEPVYDLDNLDQLPRNVTLGKIMNRSYYPPPEEAEYIPADDLRLLYGILMHGSPNSTIRLIEALYEERQDHLFVIHVDAKEVNDEAYEALYLYAHTRDYVHIVPNEYRVRVNWGGFSMVNATMQILKYTFALLDNSSLTHPLEFHKFVHLASTSYPIKSNTKIRETIASHPLDANLLNVIMKPIRPNPTVWHHFVECDDALHRIYRLPPLTRPTNGIDLYTSSQWFIISRDFAEYLAQAKEGTLVHEFLRYAEHVVVSDETFFGTVLRNSEFCTKHHNRNYLHLQFDRWENDIDGALRDRRKCPMPDPDKCGRSPTTMTLDYLFALDLSNDLFARKFSDEDDSKIKEVIDMKRSADEDQIRDIAAGNYTPEPQVINTSFEGHGVLIVAEETAHDSIPLCLGLGSSGNKAKLVPCFQPHVVKTLANDWETGAVIEDEVITNNHWEVGPCSSDGALERSMETAKMVMTPGLHTVGGPHCMIKQYNGERVGRCLDIEGERIEAGGQIQVYPCHNKWHQMFGFGDGNQVSTGSVFNSIPTHLVERRRNSGHTQESRMCLGVLGRGEKSSSWSKPLLNRNEFVPERLKKYKKSGIVPPFKLWKDKQILTVPCFDTDDVIDFLFVPFIREEYSDFLSEADGDEL